MKKLFFVITILIALCNTIHAQEIKLEFHLDSGQTYLHNMQSSSEMTQDVSGQQIKIKIFISGVMAFTVKGYDDSVYYMDVRYKSLSMTMQLPTGTSAFSSENPDSQGFLSKLLAEIKGKPFYITMYKTGKIREIKNFDSIFFNAFKKIPEMSEAQKQQLKEQLTKNFGDKAFKGNFETVTAIFPEKPVSIGSNWTINTQMEAGMGAMVSTEYILKEMNDSYCIITGNGVIKTDDKDAYIQISGMPTRYNLLGTTLLTIKIDRKSGWVMTSDSKQNMEGNVEIKDNPIIPGGMTLPIKFESQLSIGSK